MFIYDPVITFSIGGILGFFAGRYFDHFLAKRRNRESIKTAEFNKAATKFRDTFRPVLKALIPPYEHLPDDLGAFLYRSFHDFKNAIIEFSAFLDNPKTKAAFLQSWYQYYCPDNDCNENCNPHFGKYSLRNLQEDEKLKIKKIARSRIEKILEFAEPK